MNGILRNWESLCDIRPDCHHHFDASGTSNAMFDKLAERSLMSPLAGTKHTYVRLAIIIYCQVLKTETKFDEKKEMESHCRAKGIADEIVIQYKGKAKE